MHTWTEMILNETIPSLRLVGSGILCPYVFLQMFLRPYNTYTKCLHLLFIYAVSFLGSGHLDANRLCFSRVIVASPDPLAPEDDDYV